MLNADNLDGKDWKPISGKITVQDNEIEYGREMRQTRGEKANEEIYTHYRTCTIGRGKLNV